MNRPSRALLTILIVTILLAPLWLSRWRAARESSTRAQSASAARQPVKGGTLLASARSEPRTFNRMASASSNPAEVFTFLTQAKLVRVNRATGLVEPWLAEKWTTADTLTYTLTLREGLKWSDGVPFTADDVVFSFAAAYGKGSVIASALMVGGKPLTARAQDARTVLITFPETLAPGIRLLDNLPIYPKHKLEASLRAGTFNAAWGANTPPTEFAGLGPFMLTRYEPGVRLVYDRNPYYWRKDDRGEQLPYLDEIVIEMIPQQDTELLRLQSGNLDITQQQLRATDIAPIRRLADQGQLQLLDLGVSTDTDHFLFNLRPEKWVKDPRAPWMNRKEFRQALSRAVDREAFANTVFLGEAVPIHGPITPGNREWFWPDITRYRFSVQDARAQLESLGLRNRDSDEWLEDERGNEARFTLEVFGGATVLERSAEVIRDSLKQVGVAVDVVPLEPNTVIEHVQTGRFDAALVSFGLSDLDPALSQDFWLSSGSAHLWNPEQKTPATEWEAQIDALIHKQAVTTDQQERKKLFIEVQRIFAENLPILHFAAPRIYIAVSPRVITMTPAVTRPQVLWNAEAVSVAPGGARPSP